MRLFLPATFALAGKTNPHSLTRPLSKARPATLPHPTLMADNTPMHWQVRAPLRSHIPRISLSSEGLEHEEIIERTIELLQEQGYTRGLAESLRHLKLAFPRSMWIVDNSGSMQHQGGRRITKPKGKRSANKVKFVQCTRWAEMEQTVEYHAQMAAALQSPIVFRLLNDPGRAAGPQQFSVAERGGDLIDQDLLVAQQTMSTVCPGGVTPLVAHLQEFRQHLATMEAKLQRDGTKVVLVLATDGMPTNNRGVCDEYTKRQFVEALRAIAGMPVWVVVRLCTDEHEVVEFWNSLDGQLELSLEVLDDFAAEAEEVHEHNKWLNYGLPLHRMREMGFHHRLFDLLDERRLLKSEVRDFFRLIFGDGQMDGIPDPETDWKTFYARISKIINDERKTWNPMTKRVEPWIDLKRFKKDFGGSGRFF